MKRGVKKRGLAPVVASVLMVLLVLVLAIIIFLWARGFIGEQVEKFGKPIEEYCDQVAFEVSVYDNELEIRNTGDVDVKHLDIKKIRGGDSEMETFNFQADAGESISGFMDFKMSDGRMPEDGGVIIYPALIGSIRGEGSKSIFTCMDHGKVLTV